MLSLLLSQYICLEYIPNTVEIYYSNIFLFSFLIFLYALHSGKTECVLKESPALKYLVSDEGEKLYMFLYSLQV